MDRAIGVEEYLPNSKLDVRDNCALQFIRAILPIAAIASFLAAGFTFSIYELPLAFKWYLSGYLVFLSVAFLLLRSLTPKVSSTNQVELLALSIFILADIGSSIGIYLIEGEPFTSMAMKVVALSLAIRRNWVYYVYVAGTIGMVVLVRAFANFAFSNALINFVFTVPIFALLFRIGTEKIWRRVFLNSDELRDNVAKLEEEKKLREQMELAMARERDEYRIANITMDNSCSLVIVEELTAIVARLDDLQSSGSSKEELEFRIQETDFFFELLGLIEILDVNQKLVHVIGAHSTQDAIERFDQTCIPDSMSAFRDFLVRVLYAREDFQAENVHRNLETGQLLFFKVQTKVAKQNGRTFAVCNLTDLTAQTLLRQQLEESEVSLRRKVDQYENERRLREKTEMQLAEAEQMHLTTSISLDMANILVNIADVTEILNYFNELRHSGTTNDQISQRLTNDSEFLKTVHSKIVTLDINQRLADAIGADSREDAVARFKKTFVPQSMPAVAEFMSSLLTETPFDGANVHRNLKTGELLNFRVQSKPLRRHNKVFFVVTFTETTTQNKMTRQQLAESETKMRIALEASKAVIWEFDLAENTMSADKEYHDLLGYPPGSLNGPISLARDLVHPNDYQESLAVTSELIQGKCQRVDHSHRLRLKNGSYRWFRFSMVRPKSDLAIGTLVDVHDAVCSEKLLRLERDVLASRADLKSRLRDLVVGLEAIWVQSKCAVHLLGPASRVVGCVSSLLESIHGFHVIGRDVSALPQSCQAAIKQGHTAVDVCENGFEKFGKYSYSTPLYCENHIHGTLCLFSPQVLNAAEEQLIERFSQIVQQLIERDYQSRRAAEFESKMLTESKLDSLGKLAGGIAHDFNNLLTVIMTHAELIGLGQADANTQLSSQQIIEAAVIASGLCEKMLTYAGEIPFELSEINISQEAESVIKMVRTGTTKRLHYGTNLATNLPDLIGDRSMISQLILNLLTNAVEATPPDGQITISTGKRILDENDLAQLYFSDWLEPGEYLFLRVTDNGVGISPDIVERIFDPFFTTKKLGSGLGLATVVGAVRRHKGCMKVSSKISEGTTITAFLPSPLSKRESQPANDIRLVVVDDQPAVLNALELMLQRQGFTVVTMSSGEEAIERMDEIGRCDAMILDQQMPNMDGVESYRYIRKMLKLLPICFTSGYTLSEEASKIVRSDAMCESLTKPFSQKLLIETIEKLLGPSNSTSNSKRSLK